MLCNFNIFNIATPMKIRFSFILWLWTSFRQKSSFSKLALIYLQQTGKHTKGMCREMTTQKNGDKNLVTQCLFYQIVFLWCLWCNIFIFQGCRENITTFLKNPPVWSAFQSKDYGYTRMNVLNKTHMHIEQVSDNMVREKYRK